MCTSLYGLRLKCQCSHKRAILNHTDDSIFGSFVQLQSQPDLLLPNAMTTRNESLCRWAACTSKDDTRGSYENILNACQHQTFPTQPAIRLKNHNLHGAINQPITPLPLSNQRGGPCSVGILPKGLGTGSHDSRVTGVCCLPITSEGCVI